MPPERRGGFDTWIGYENNNSQWDCWVRGDQGDDAFHYRLPGYETDCLTDLLIDYLRQQGQARKDGHGRDRRPFCLARTVSWDVRRDVMRGLYRFWLWSIVSFLLFGCARATPPAHWPTAGWQVSTPEAQGVDSQRLADMLGAIQEQGYAIDSASVVRNGYLVLDAYVHPYRPDEKHGIYSCTKSIVSALIGIAINKGYIEGVEKPLLDFFPGRTVAYLDAAKESITLEHVLTMSSGLECRDSYLYRWRGLNEMRQSEDWVQYMLDLPMAEKPGMRFEYCNGGSFLLSAIVQESTGMSALDYAEEHLFGPLGISDVTWPANPQGISIGWGEMRVRPHDMLKIGALYLNEGRWEGKQIVPTEWVQASTRKYMDGTLQDGYGYQWWIDDSGIYMALGYGGQYILVAPEQNMVVVFTSDLEERDFYVPQRLFEEYILPAVQSSTPLPENAKGVELLRSRVQALASP